MAAPPQHASGHELEQLIPPSTTDQPPTNDERKKAHNRNASVAADSSEASLDAGTSRPGWAPFYLQTTTLIGFAALYLVLLLAIIVLAIADAERDGISTAKSSEHYLWTYGPTAGTHPFVH